MGIAFLISASLGRVEGVRVWRDVDKQPKPDEDAG
jgi:hypothetical protein